jgi:predicted site-specific integrase-resolvase
VGLLGEDHIKTPGGKYRYPESEIKRLFGEKALERQKQRLVEYAKSKGLES